MNKTVLYVLRKQSLKNVSSVFVYMRQIETIIGSFREIFSDVAGQLSDRLKVFVGQERNNRTLLCLNTGLSTFSKYCKFDGKYAGNLCN